jgi:hypothetical protein
MTVMVLRRSNPVSILMPLNKHAIHLPEAASDLIAFPDLVEEHEEDKVTCSRRYSAG